MYFRIFHTCSQNRERAALALVQAAVVVAEVITTAARRTACRATHALEELVVRAPVVCVVVVHTGNPGVARVGAPQEGEDDVQRGQEGTIPSGARGMFL